MVARILVTAAALTVLASCALPPEAGFVGPPVTEPEIRDIAPVVRAQASRRDDTINSYKRRADGAIEVWTEKSMIYVVRKSPSGSWAIADVQAIEY